MEIVKRITTSGSSIELYFQVNPSAGELEIIDNYGMRNYRVHTKDGGLRGKYFTHINMQQAYRAQIGKVKNRWSAALTRTTGFIVADFLIFIVHAIWRLFVTLLRLFLGRRRRLDSLMKGLKITSSKPERIREAEFFIMISIAAIERCIGYVEDLGVEKLYVGRDIFLELDGLDFAGAGSSTDDEFDQLNSAMNRLTKVET